MSKEDGYFTLPLACLHSGDSPLSALEIMLPVGIVNAGVGYRTKHGDAAFETLLSEARLRAHSQGYPGHPPAALKLRYYSVSRTQLTMTKDDAKQVWNDSLAGWQLLGLSGGNRARDAEFWLTHHRPGKVFFRIRSDLMWNAIHTARHENGMDTPRPDRPISWREFRVLAAIYSAQTNSFGFSFIGWKNIQARSSGFHNNVGFQSSVDSLPPHCRPLSRSQIRTATENLEALGFFARCRYAAGSRGGLMAYSIRSTPEELHKSVEKWLEHNRWKKQQVAENRLRDRTACEIIKLPPIKKRELQAAASCQQNEGILPLHDGEVAKPPPL